MKYFSFFYAVAAFFAHCCWKVFHCADVVPNKAKRIFIYTSPFLEWGLLIMLFFFIYKTSMERNWGTGNIIVLWTGLTIFILNPLISIIFLSSIIRTDRWHKNIMPLLMVLNHSLILTLIVSSTCRNINDVPLFVRFILDLSFPTTVTIWFLAFFICALLRDWQYTNLQKKLEGKGKDEIKPPSQ